MFTVCPKCALTLVVTAADLRVAQGYVRCGRCSSVFNALARLSERQAAAENPEADPAAAAAPPAASPLARAPTPQPVEATASTPHSPTLESLPDEPVVPETALEFNPNTTDVNSVFVAAPPNPQWTAATGSFRALVAANHDTTSDPEPSVEVEIDSAFLAYMLDSEAPAPEAQAAAPTVPSSEERAAPAGAAPGIPPVAARRARLLDKAAAPAAADPGPSRATPRLRSLTEEEAIQEAEALSLDDATLPDTDDEAAAPHPLARFLPYAWPAGTALAALLLLAQVVNHYRDELAASARFNHTLTALYGSLGIHLFPQWDLRAYDVRQLGASGDPAGAGLITVRASIKNGASQPQPLPLLRVTLQDRFGNRIAARDVAPNAYLPSAMPASFAAGQARVQQLMAGGVRAQG
jgi:predicted Zn finger-like uncharacterized protein